MKERKKSISKSNGVKKMIKNSLNSSSSGSILDSSLNRQYSRSHQRRFHRRFPAIEPFEKLINWYNCALISDILLQGYLYISENYFAFYSNILGYKTQVLIPTSDVISVTKEKTAKIFPNAVGICTEQGKYVFGSLISREATYKLIKHVWKNALVQDVSQSYFDNLLNCDDLKSEKDASIVNNSEKNLKFVEKSSDLTLSKSSKYDSFNLSDSHLFSSSFKEYCDSSNLLSSDNLDLTEIFDEFPEKEPNNLKEVQQNYESKLNQDVIKDEFNFVLRLKNWPRYYMHLNIFRKSCRNLILIFAVILIVLLVISVVILLYKIDQTHNKLITFQKLVSLIRKSDEYSCRWYIKEKK